MLALKLATAQQDAIFFYLFYYHQTHEFKISVVRTSATWRTILSIKNDRYLLFCISDFSSG